MKNVCKITVITAIAVLFALTTTVGFAQDAGGKVVNSAEELKAYLDTQPANSPDKPIMVKMSNVNDKMIKDIVEALNSAGKYVSLDLTGSPLKAITTSLINRAFGSCKMLAGIIIPDSVASIRESAFYNCTSLASVTIGKGVKVIDEGAFMKCESLTSVTFQGAISARGFDLGAFLGLGDLRKKHLAGGIGTYTRPDGKSDTWTKQ
jgi:hypothetical protein